MSDSRGFPFDSVGRRFMKFAEKKLQKGMNYLEAQLNSANTDHHSPYNYNTPYPGVNEVLPNTAPPTQTNVPGSKYQGYSNPNHSYAAQPGFQPSAPHTATAPQSFGGAQPAPFDGTPPPPAPFTEPFQQPGTAALQAPNNAAITLSNASGPIVTQDLLLQMQARIPSACTSLGVATVTEARKGVSRVLSPTREDIELFGMQLKNSQVEAVEPNWNNVDDQLPCFAISYVQHVAQGRYKFSPEQWTNFHAAVQAIAAAGVKHFRVWLDQCLWLRDASQANWAHTGIVPYVLWPVIALGAKPPGGERTKDSFHRMWPFVEQLAGLWGLGVIVASEYRNQNLVEGDHRPWLSYNLRLKTEPESDLMIILLNIFHGAADALETGWVDDVNELKEMAKANVMYSNPQVIIGSDWKIRFSSISPLGCVTAIQNIKMPTKAKFLGGVDIYLDGSRTLKCDNWHGIREWLSGNDSPIPANNHDVTMLNICMKKYNILTNVGEYQLLDLGSVTNALWLVVAMQGRSSNFSRGRVAWTKILTGPRSSRLREIIGSADINGVQRVLSDQLMNSSLRIQSANEVKNAIEWM